MNYRRPNYSPGMRHSRGNEFKADDSVVGCSLTSMPPNRLGIAPTVVRLSGKTPPCPQTCNLSSLLLTCSASYNCGGKSFHLSGDNLDD